MKKYNGLETYGEPPKKSLKERFERTKEQAEGVMKHEGIRKVFNAVKSYHPRGYEETGQHQEERHEKKVKKPKLLPKNSPFGAFGKPQKGTEFSQQYKWP